MCVCLAVCGEGLDVRLSVFQCTKISFQVLGVDLELLVVSLKAEPL